MILVSGCPRSGTSVTMDILRKSLGEENIIGKRLTEMGVDEPECKQFDGERDAHFTVREYVFNKSRAESKSKITQEQLDQKSKMKDLNPNGFWECQFTTGGISYNFGNRQQLTDLYKTGKNKVVKVVSQGLLKSDPKYIDKVIYLIRHPRNVAKSQERLQRQFTLDFGKDKKNIFDNLVVHSPEMYIDVTLKACRWIKENPDIPILYIDFNDLQSNPDREIQKMAAFVGYGDFNKAKDIVTIAGKPSGTAATASAIAVKNHSLAPTINSK